ncbi:flagellar biosynthesis protein FlhB [Lysobacter sp. TY2-98]|uniref:flagellar biosynthesis protein FlhB n=1 Tax=Lysobacter sp. TY2-98 TaxID=2290922 RepID=UPI000E203EEF|nr:flagellar biosynthesis protein FlhB [Lysobacter sp. TY2-98]AXK71204.1 flagellar biosynthesis protein FlhB [Lysobacter sp. TY2-98]
MSETDNEDRTEAPSEKRLREARERGDVPRSKELANVAVLGCATLALKITGPHIGAASRDWMRNALQFDPSLINDPNRLPVYAAKTGAALLMQVSPLILAALAGCFVAPALMSGLRFSGAAFKADLTRLNPMAGLSRMYGKESLTELGRALLRLLLIGGIAAIVIKGSMSRLMDMPKQSLEMAVANGVDTVLGLFLALIIALAALAAIDVPYQRFAWRAKLKMTKQELRDEAKESDGNPEVKARMRHAAREMANRRMMDAVPTADVIITNPTHYAVALKYEAGGMRAPKVVAKGVDEMALRIRELAGQHKVSLVEAPPLARALYRQCKVDEEIPVKLYAAVAQVLTYIFQLRKWHPSRGPMPQLVQVDVGADGAPDPVGDNA